MKTFLQFISLAAIFYSNSNALTCNQCKPTLIDPHCQKFVIQTGCGSDENNYCVDILYNKGTKSLSRLEKACVSDENLGKRCPEADKIECVPCDEDLCNKMAITDFVSLFEVTPEEST